jgi:hypothetical protein
METSRTKLVMDCFKTGNRLSFLNFLAGIECGEGTDTGNCKISDGQFGSDTDYISTFLSVNRLESILIIFRGMRFR